MYKISLFALVITSVELIVGDKRSGRQYEIVPHNSRAVAPNAARYPDKQEDYSLPPTPRKPKVFDANSRRGP